MIRTVQLLREAVPAQRDREGNVQQDLAWIVHRPGAAPNSHRRRHLLVQPGPASGLNQEHGTGLRHHRPAAAQDMDAWIGPNTLLTCGSGWRRFYRPLPNGATATRADYVFPTERPFAGVRYVLRTGVAWRDVPGPPAGPVPARMTLRTRSGSSASITWAMKPPIDRPSRSNRVPGSTARYRGPSLTCHNEVRRVGLADLRGLYSVRQAPRGSVADFV